MTKNTAPNRAALKGSLDYIGMGGTLSIPIHLYKKATPYSGTPGADFHMYHDQCHGRIRYQNFCEHCEKVIERGEVVKLTELGEDNKVEVSRDELDEILYGEKSSIEMLNTVPLAKIGPLLASGTLFISDTYSVGPFKNPSNTRSKKTSLGRASQQLRLLLDTLAKNKQFLVVKVPVGGLVRYGILLPSGDLMTLLYEEEVRESVEMDYGPGEGYPKENLTSLAKFFKTIEEPDLELPTSADIIKQVQDLVESKEPAVAIKAAKPTKSKEKPVIDVLDFMGNLKEAIEKDKTRRKKATVK